MATFAELCADVQIITNRPDLVADTKLAVRQATLKMHHTDYYPKDVFETGIRFQDLTNIQSFAYRNTIPRWRAFKYLRRFSDPALSSDTGSIPGHFLKLLDPEASLDRYEINKENICYMAGDMLEIRANPPLQYAVVGCYVHPDITEATYSSWIAVEHPFAIVNEAAAIIFKTIGWDEQAAAMKQASGEQILLLKQQITGAGY